MRSHVAVVASLFLLAGCSFQPPATVNAVASSPSQGPGHDRRSPRDRAVRVSPPARLKAAFETTAARSDNPDFSDFLRMHAGGGFGSGFLVTHTSAEGTAAFVVTNRHVVAESTEAEVSFSDGTTYKSCDVIYASAKHNLAVLGVRVRAPRPRRPASSRGGGRHRSPPSSPPDIRGSAANRAIRSRTARCRTPGSRCPSSAWRAPSSSTPPPSNPGSSGGPLTNESGAVGVNTMASMFFAVPSSAVVDTVHAHALDAHKRSAQWMTAELDKACTTL